MKIIDKIFYFSMFFSILSAFIYFFSSLNGFYYNKIFFAIAILFFIFCIFLYFLKFFYISFFGNKEQKEKLRRAYMSNEERMAEDIEIMKKELLELKKNKT